MLMSSQYSYSIKSSNRKLPQLPETLVLELDNKKPRLVPDCYPINLGKCFLGYLGFNFTNALQFLIKRIKIDSHLLIGLKRKAKNA